MARHAIAAQQFHRLRRQAAVEALLARLSGQTAHLLSYEEVTRALRVQGQSSAGLKQVPVAKIVGSVGRYNDFTRTFLPLQDADQERWVSVRTAADHVGDLPPVELYRIGESYFVLDGNHRVSIARQQGIEYIDALVTEVHTRVPLPEGDDPDAMIIAAEYAAFLEWSRLDTQRQDIDLRVSVPGQYAHLENHIEAYRFLVEQAEETEFELPDAAARWYDGAYVPLAEAIREQGILRYFPERTETDFYIWLARHRAELENQFGVHLTPEGTVSHLLDQVRLPEVTEDASFMTRARRRITRLNAPRDSASLATTQLQSRTVARYSDRLFDEILLPVDLRREMSVALLRQALAVAVSEDARLGVLGIAPEDMTSDQHAAAAAALETTISERTTTLELPADVIVERGDLAAAIKRLSLLYDLVMVDRTFGEIQPGSGVSAALREVIRDSHRPVWLVGQPSDPPLASRVAVVIDEAERGRESLFVAAYLAEKWQIPLAVIQTGNGRSAQDAASHALQYLDMHEIPVTIHAISSGEPAKSLLDLAQQEQFDLLIMPGISPRRRAGFSEAALLSVIAAWPHAILISAWN